MPARKPDGTVTESFNVSLNRWRVRFPGGGLKYRYRWVMEQHLGRELHPDEYVHHINGDCTDDRLENLTLVSPQTHMGHHRDDISRGLRRNWKHEWSAEYPACCECGRTDRRHIGRGFCAGCYWVQLDRNGRREAYRRKA